LNFCYAESVYVAYGRFFKRPDLMKRGGRSVQNLQPPASIFGFHFTSRIAAGRERDRSAGPGSKVAENAGGKARRSKDR
jgi:hypothetical protein